MRRIVCWFTALGLTVALSLNLVGCNVEQVLDEISKQTSKSAKRITASVPPQAVVRDDDTIHVASFNIQVFGTSKSKKPQVMEILADVVRRFDVVAIQELRSKDQTVVPKFVDLINANGRHYDYLVGPRLGRSSSKEQYVFLFDAARIEPIPNSIYTIDDPQDLLHREPFVASFRVRGLPTEEAFSFTLVNIHTDPDETDTELDALDDVFRAVRQIGGAEDDVILLGDLNVDERHLGELGRLPNIGWTGAGQTTNTPRNKSYDNIVFDRTATVEFTGTAGVFDLIDEYQITEEQALDVSDHMPVWAAFSAREGSNGRVASGSGDTSRR